MSNSMSLPIPVVGLDAGPNWANDINNCLGLIAEHTHTSGAGVPITPTGININTSLAFNGNAAISLAYVNMLAQGTGVATPSNASLYVNGVDLFYKDGAGNNITITQGGNVLAGSSGISSGTASASFSGNILTVIQAPGVAAPIDAASYILRYNGSYPTPAGAAIVLQAPSSLPGGYALTFPTGLPSINNAVMVGNTAGALTFISSDSVAQNMTSVGANAIGTAMGATGANAIGVSMTSSGANAVIADITAVSSGPANIIGASMNTTATNLQSGGKNVVVSQTNAASSLAIIRGQVNSGGGVTIGEGFTCTPSGGTIFVVNFSTSFASPPAVVACSAADINTYCTVNAITASSCQVITFKDGVGATFNPFNFIAIGPR